MLMKLQSSDANRPLRSIRVLPSASTTRPTTWHVSDNLSPHLAWSGRAPGTRSFVLVCMDPDVPTVADDVNQEGKTLPVEMPRTDFCHWAMVDISTGCHRTGDWPAVPTA
jgi:phosphatidylethanolamine-binding protein (PEBP) family uncharacterized protein